MIDWVRKAFYLGLGTMVVTKEKAEQIMDELVKTGNLEKSEAAKMLDELVEKGQQQKAAITEAVKKEFAEFRTDMGIITRKEFSDLEASIQEINERLKKLEERLSSGQ
ncbi:MAG: DUF1640 domain-containing protein [Firmicutes bacterium]|nr:DUF1640 domain-containing protein [Bacillota bacterium]